MKWALIIFVSLSSYRTDAIAVTSVPMADETVCNLAAAGVMLNKPKQYRVTTICVRAQ